MAEAFSSALGIPLGISSPSSASGFKSFFAFWIGGAASDGSSPVPPPTVNYQGDGKKRRKRKKNETYKLFSEIEKTLCEFFNDPEEIVSTLSVTKENSINTALYRLEELSVDYSDLVARLYQIKNDFQVFMARRERELEDDDEEFLLM